MANTTDLKIPLYLLRIKSHESRRIQIAVGLQKSKHFDFCLCLLLTGLIHAADKNQ